MIVQINVAERSYSRNIRTGEKRHWITIRQVSVVDYLWWKLYHWYDMRIPTGIPGWRKFDQFLADRFDAQILMGFEFDPEPRWCDKIRTWVYSQDMRCDHLHRRGKVIARIEVDDDTYDAFKVD